MSKQNHGIRGKLRRAFTITELVIVIAVIAILAAVLIPTFANVIDNAKKSHDEQYVKEINVTLNSYTVQGGAAPKDYEELMLALAEDGYCDVSNPFLLATKLKQDNVYLVWYPNANYVSLIDTSDGRYVITFSPEIGLGNGVTVYDSMGGGGTELGYALCSTGTPDGPYIAGVYYDFYIASGGDITAFNQQFGNKYANVESEVEDKMWGNTIIAAVNNQKQGYTYSASIAKEIEDQLASAATNIVVAVPSTSGSEAVSETVQAQVVRSTLATLATLSNDNASASKLANKKVSFGESSDALKGVSVDLSDVSLTAIASVHRDSITDNQSLPSSFSVDFAGLTLTGYELEANFSPKGAVFQTEDDNNFPDGAYNYSYGLFGTLYAKQGETVTISNLNIKDVNIDLNGRVINIDGKEGVPTITDSAGIVAGCVRGNAVFENITIDGKQADGSNGSIRAYDSPAAIVGRAYGVTESGAANNTVTIRNCSVSNLDIYGQRRGGGLFGIHSAGTSVVVSGVTMDNVHVIVERNVEGDDAGDRRTSIGGLIGGYVNNADGVDSLWENITITNSTCVNNYTPLEGATSTPIWQDGGVYYTKNGQENFVYSSANGGAASGEATGALPLSDANFIKLLGHLNTTKETTFTIKGLSIDGTDIEDTVFEKTSVSYDGTTVKFVKAAA